MGKVGGRLELEVVVVPGEPAFVPTDEDVTCKIDAADEENNAPQSAVGDSSGLVACGL